MNQVKTHDFFYRPHHDAQRHCEVSVKNNLTY